MHTVYILFSEKLDRFYTGETTDLDKRIAFHMDSPANKFTAKAKDWKLFLQFQCECKPQALKIERHIKNMKSKTYIRNLLKYPEIIDKLKKEYPC
ncbi:GIY-YIG nuclease family protein [Leeuwenhoekiella aestuarii]|uniref:Putative endonuclease n=1 Tax=Leeuwenhoekiella aestuarii TaxID=2249426 RepID=A0A4Q0NVU8_9FLAO|nr:GIY-YIG nuclease family protein [Leeuwenhoekiella aestuarii]RXG14374.1 putative endonuclease [Leeuwenhoekiella aestuarii]